MDNRTRDLNQSELMHTGMQVGQYLILENIAQGGQAALWSAWDHPQQRVVALKQVLDTRDDRTRIEFDMVRHLDHPHIVRLHTLERSQTGHYIVMDYFPFGSLEGLVRKGPLPLEEVFQLCRDIVSALIYTHAQQIVHRDLKPRNILVDGQRRAYLTDFGIARSLSATTSAYHTGQGTAAYSSPEQHNLSQISPQTDLYSLGVMIYEMLTGDLPWHGQTALAVMQMSHGFEMPDPHLLNAAAPAAMGNILRQLTAANPDQRPASAEAAWALIAPLLAPGQSMALSSLADPGFDVRSDAELLIHSELGPWVGAREFNTRLSSFAVIHAYHAGRLQAGELPGETLYAYLLHGSLHWSFEADFWWGAPVEARTRMAACERLLAREIDTLSSTLMEQMLRNPEHLPAGETISSYTVSAIAQYLDGPAGAAALRLLGRLSPHSEHWSGESLSVTSSLELARLAAGDGPLGSTAARLIGQIKSETAFVHLLESGAEAAALSAWRSAGSQPPGLSRAQRASLTGSLLRAALRPTFTELWPLLRMCLLGAVIALILHIYSGYRWASLLDSVRLLNAVGGGLLFGPLIGLGLAIAGLLPVRLSPLEAGKRFLLSVLIGSPVLLLGFVAYHLLFLGLFPASLGLLAAGVLLCSTMALLSMSKLPSLARILLAALLNSLILAGSWQSFLAWGQAPLLYYEPVWSLSTLLSILLGALPLGALPFMNGWSAGVPEHVT